MIPASPFHPFPTARVCIETAGCAFNVSDSEAMAGALLRAGFAIASRPADADLLILNTCTVKDRTFRAFRKRLEALRSGPTGRASPRLLVAGCIPKAFERSDLLRDVSTLGPDAVGRVAEAARETLAGRIVHFHNGSAEERIALPVQRRHPCVHILPISRGCLSACTFCQTRLARGRLVSFPPEAILDQARRALDEGVRIFWVTSQDTGAYGRDIGHPLPRLLRSLLDLDGDFRLRLGMSSPRWIAERLDEVLDLLDHPKMFRFLHVPIQSGSDRVLGAMKRDGNLAQFRAIHAGLRSRFPDAGFLTDLIVGYPTETGEDFERTMELIGELRLGLVNLSRFSPRPGTAAARLPGLPASVVAARSRRLARRVRAMAAEALARGVGRRCRVIVERVTPRGAPLARTDGYEAVILDAPLVPGSSAGVVLTGAEPFHYFGQLV